MPVFVSWVHLLPAYANIIEWLDQATETEYSDYMISSSARDLVARITPDLEAAGLDIEPKSAGHGAAYLPAFIDMVDTLLGLTSIEGRGWPQS
jgi:hypothetical protein